MIPESIIKAARILIVDDEPAVVDVLKRLLQRAGYEDLYAAGDAEAATRLGTEIEPDLILLDLSIPGGDSFGLLESLQSVAPSGRPVPVLVLTGDATMERRRRALAAGALEVLAKPVDYVELMLRIWNILEMRFAYLRAADEGRALEESSGGRER